MRSIRRVSGFSRRGFGGALAFAWCTQRARGTIDIDVNVFVPFLACRDLAVFKAFFDRTKHWADLEEMQMAGTVTLA